MEILDLTRRNVLRGMGAASVMAPLALHSSDINEENISKTKIGNILFTDISINHEVNVNYPIMHKRRIPGLCRERRQSVHL